MENRNEPRLMSAQSSSQEISTSELAMRQRGSGQSRAPRMSDVKIKSEISDAMDVGEEKEKGDPEYVFPYDQKQEEQVPDYCLNVVQMSAFFQAFVDGYALYGGVFTAYHQKGTLVEIEGVLFRISDSGEVAKMYGMKREAFTG